MKRILSLLCALTLLFCTAPTFAGESALDHCFSQSLSLHSLMLEKAALSSLYGANIAAEIDAIAAALKGPVLYVTMLHYDTQGAFMRYALANGMEEAELPAMSETLLASYDKGMPAMLLSEQAAQYSDMSIAATSMLATSGTGLAPAMTQDALVVLDFGTDYQFVCAFTPTKDGIVSASAYPLPAELDIISAFCEFFALSQDDVKRYAGDVLYRKSADEALKEYAYNLRNSLVEAAAHLPMGAERPEVMAYIDDAVFHLYRPAQLARLRMILLTEDLLPGVSATTAHTLLSNLTTTYNASVSMEFAYALSYFSATDSFDMPRSMPAAAIVQMEYEVKVDEELGTYSIVCVFSPTQQGDVLGSAHFVLNYPQVKFIDALTTGELGFTIDPALVIELEP